MFLDPHLITYHLNIGVQIIAMSELSMSTLCIIIYFRWNESHFLALGYKGGELPSSNSNFPYNCASYQSSFSREIYWIGGSPLVERG